MRCARPSTRAINLRPSQPPLRFSSDKARRNRELNEALAEQCEYHAIQEAVNDSGNNDRVVIMPGRYREPESRHSPVNDPKCADLTQQDSRGALTPSYRYQVTCPNDQNLVYVQGRKVPKEPAPSPRSPTARGSPTRGPACAATSRSRARGRAPTT